MLCLPVLGVRQKGLSNGSFTCFDGKTYKLKRSNGVEKFYVQVSADSALIEIDAVPDFVLKEAIEHGNW